ncbi:MAG TPA: ABC transporter ATP-binding protein, partial [Fibrobacteria bacterium]|nr:ABC transporter ATP-binding protein [Fibrobacteria bacterium]
SETTHLSVRELVALGRAPHTGWLGRLSEADAAKVQRALEVTGCLDHAARRLGELSDGERQKVLIARALAQDTPVLLLDEPTAHLDLPNRVTVMQLLKSLAEAEGKAVLLSTHELDLALQAADEIWLMATDGGLRCGAPEDLILDGTLASAFRREGFEFDPATGFVRFQRPARGWVLLYGEGPRAQWTRRALERKGFRVTGSSATVPSTDARVSVRVLAAGNEPALWRLEAGESREDFPTLGALVDALPDAANRPALVEA